MEPEVFGERLRDARKSKGISQEALGEIVGKEQGAISEYESGERKLAAHELPDYASALEVPVVYFFMDSLGAETDKEAALLEWFRMLPEDRQQRVFEFTEDQAARVPRVVGDQRDPSKSTPGKGRRKDDGHNSR